MHERVNDGVVDGLVNLGVAALGNKLCLLAELFAHVAYDAVHLVEGALQRHHSDGHDDILKLVGELAKLAYGFCEVVQPQPLKVGVAGDHRLSRNDLTDEIHKLVKLGLVNADKALLNSLGDVARLNLGNCGSGAVCNRCGFAGCGRGLTLSRGLFLLHGCAAV